MAKKRGGIVGENRKFEGGGGSEKVIASFSQIDRPDVSETGEERRRIRAQQGGLQGKET